MRRRVTVMNEEYRSLVFTVSCDCLYVCSSGRGQMGRRPISRALAVRFGVTRPPGPIGVVVALGHA